MNWDCLIRFAMSLSEVVGLVHLAALEVPPASVSASVVGDAYVAYRVVRARRQAISEGPVLAE